MTRLSAALFGLTFLAAGCATEPSADADAMAAPETADGAMADGTMAGDAVAGTAMEGDDIAGMTSGDAITPDAEPTHEAFTQARFDALQAEGARVLVDVYAPWCPDCAKQQTAIAAYQAEHPDLHVLRVDFDSQKPVVRQFGAPRQATLIYFEGAEQKWLKVAESRPEALAAALDGAA